MSHKRVFFEQEARSRVQRGATALADAVRVTPGPMPHLEDGRPVRCLADVSVGERVVVRQVLFDVIRNWCDPRGVSRGEVVCCKARDSHTLLLHTKAGRSLEMDRFYACFIEIEALTAS